MTRNVGLIFNAQERFATIVTGPVAGGVNLKLQSVSGKNHGLPVLKELSKALIGEYFVIAESIGSSC